METKRIFLIGYMGSGKSTLGRKLALRMGRSFTDLDVYIEQMTGRTIPDIFNTDGEEFFRNLEKKYLAEVATHDNVVISTGGGTPCFFNNMEFMLERGLVIYLKLKPEIIISRLKQAKKERPILKNQAGYDADEFILQQLQERERWYSLAHASINPLTNSVDDVIRLISFYHPPS